MRCLLCALLALASVPAPDDAQLVRVRDVAAGIAVSYPAAWHRRRAVTTLGYPRERLVLSTDALPPPGPAGPVPAAALRRLRPDGALIWLIEYRPPRGRVFGGDRVRRRDFPSRPHRFHLSPRPLSADASCAPGRCARLSFRDADRPFVVFVALGPQAPTWRVAQVEATLDSLQIEPLPPPPPDPYEGWGLLTTESGDSFRVPPGWAAARTAVPRALARPRTLFLTASAPLAGFPARPRRSVTVVPHPLPLAVAAGVPLDGGLVWVVEEARGPASPAFPRTVPSRRLALRPTGSPLPDAGSLRWLRGRFAFRGYRFSAWVALGAAAPAEHEQRARLAAASLAVSACLRDPPPPECAGGVPLDP